MLLFVSVNAGEKNFSFTDLEGKKVQVMSVEKGVTDRSVCFTLKDNIDNKERMLKAGKSRVPRTEVDLTELYARNRTLRAVDAAMLNAIYFAFTPEDIESLSNEKITLVPIWDGNGDILAFKDSKFAALPAEKIAKLMYEIQKNVKFNVIDDRLNYYQAHNIKITVDCRQVNA